MENIKIDSMKNTQVRTRFAPSPTGLLHLGNVRTALFSWLFAKRQKGVFILRIEDTDQERSIQETVPEILADLRWLGLTWQEGPDCGGEVGPYIQSERQVIYDEFYQRLEVASLVYPCFCTEAQLALSRKTQLAAGLPPRYAGTCSALSYDEIQKKRVQGLQPTLRFRVPTEGSITFVDGLKGEQQFRCHDIGDFIIRRADGTAPFLFCNAIDDALMGITHVVRGDDHLANTPRQLLILKALGLPIPQHIHIPLITAVGGAPLSKRMGSLSLKAMRTQGYFREAIINQLARLGHTYESHALLSLPALAAAFSLDRIATSAAHFDETQLLHWQKQVILKKQPQLLWDWMVGCLENVIPESQQHEFVEWIRPNILFPTEAVVWAQCLTHNELVFSAEAHNILKNAHPQLLPLVAEKLQDPTLEFKNLVNAIGEILQVRGKALYQPIRVALTGQLEGPELRPLVQLLGRDRAIERLKKGMLC